MADSKRGQMYQDLAFDLLCCVPYIKSLKEINERPHTIDSYIII